MAPSEGRCSDCNWFIDTTPAGPPPNKNWSITIDPIGNNPGLPYSTNSAYGITLDVPSCKYYVWQKPVLAWSEVGTKRLSLLMFERDRNQSDGAPGYTAYFVRLPGEVFTSRNEFNFVRIRHGRLYLLAGGGTAEKRAAAYYGEPSRIFVRDGSPIDPAVFDFVLPPEAPAPRKRPSRPGVWGSQEDWEWVRDQHLPRPLLLEESSLYSHVASALEPYEASALLEQIRLSQSVSEDDDQTCFVVNRDAPRLSVAAPRSISAQYDAPDGVVINLTMVTSQDGRLLSATRRRSDGARVRYLIPPVDQVKLRGN